MCVEKRRKWWGGVKTTPVAPKNIENGWGGVKTTPVAPKNVENGWGGVKTIPVAPKNIENGWGGVETTPVVSWCDVARRGNLLRHVILLLAMVDSLE